MGVITTLVVVMMMIMVMMTMMTWAILRGLLVFYGFKHFK